MQHPDYPITFKPAIARYDFDQTYDVLEFVHLPQGFDGLMESLGIPAFELMAVDRFTPYRYLWAEQYSDYVYNFLKQFNFSPHSSILERVLKDYTGNLAIDITKHPRFVGAVNSLDNVDVGSVVFYKNSFQVVYYSPSSDENLSAILQTNNMFYRDILRVFVNVDQIDLNYKNTPPVELVGGVERVATGWYDASVYVPPFLFTGDKYNTTAEYPLQLTAGEYCVTFLVEQGQQTGLIGGITTINQVYRCFTLAEDTTIDLNKIINGIVADDYPLYAYHQETGVEVPQQHPRAVITYNETSRFCVNSLVLSKQVNGTWQQQTVASPHKFLFYSDIADYFTEVSEALMQYFAVDYSYASLPYYNYLSVPFRHTLSRLFCSYHIHNDISYSTFTDSFNNTFVSARNNLFPFIDSVELTYGVIPQYFLDLCYLARANNNKWGGSLYQDLGEVDYNKVFTPTNESLRGQFLNWGNYNDERLIIDLDNVDYKVDYTGYNDGLNIAYNNDCQFRFSLLPTNYTALLSIPSVVHRVNHKLGYFYNLLYPFCKYREVIIEHPAISVENPVYTCAKWEYSTYLGLLDFLPTSSTPPTFKELDWQFNTLDNSYQGNVIANPQEGDSVLFLSSLPYSITINYQLCDIDEYRALRTVLPEQDYLNYLLTTKAQLEAQ